jgi:hypothetical protein
VSARYSGCVTTGQAIKKISETSGRPKGGRDSGRPCTKFLLDSVADLLHPNRERVPVAVDLSSPIGPPSGLTHHPR